MKAPKSTRSAGTSLVEVMVAVIILAVLATGGAAFLFQSRTQVIIQEDRRVALEAANARMEELRATPYNVLKPENEDFKLYFLSKQTGTWTHTQSDPLETIDVNGRVLPISTTVKYMDADGSSKSYDLLKLKIKVGYRLNDDERVILESFYAE